MSSLTRRRTPLILLASILLGIWLILAGLFCQLNQSLSEADVEFQKLQEFLAVLSAELSDLQLGIAAIGNDSHHSAFPHEPHKRSFESNEKCNTNLCEQPVESEYCAQGAQGPAGRAGESGEDGLDGLDGEPGAPGIALVYGQEAPGCIVCPAGPPGLCGPPGTPGPPGEEGEVGSRGVAGRAGMPGLKGLTGDTGPPGSIGLPGAGGEPGRNGVRGKGRPGRQGPEGPIGEIGLPGLTGTSARAGAPGLVGPTGPRGVDGVDGTPGAEGEPGPRGDPGPDAQYCPCPQRSMRTEIGMKPAWVPRFRPIEKWSPQRVTPPSLANKQKAWLKTTPAASEEGLTATAEASAHRSKTGYRYNYDRVEFRKALLKKILKADKRRRSQWEQ